MRAHTKKAPREPAPAASQEKRDDTDATLAVERDKVDVSLTAKRTTVEAHTDDAVQVVRDRADEVVQTARDDADRLLADAPTSSAAEAISQRQRSREDTAIESERGRVDAVLERERGARKQYLAEFLAVEREATDARLNEERAQADEELAVRDEFLATVSHDLRALLSGLVFNADALAKMAPAGLSGAAIRQHASLGRRLAARMNRLVNDLLDVVGIDAGKLTIVPERVSVGKLLEDALESFGPIAAAAQVTLEAHPPTVPLHASIDEGRIAQVLANLVSNAIKFTPAKGVVSLTVKRTGKEIVFCVRDTGVGISKADLETVFGRLRQVSTDRRGLGLGLYISKSLVEAHGGRIWVESEVDKGSAFYFAVPTEPAPAPETAP